MRPAFHPDASFFGYAGEQLAIGTPFLFEWIDKNGSAPNIEPRFICVDILESIAVVRLEVGMSERNTPQKALESWKQIAAYLDRSERTVRRWEARGSRFTAAGTKSRTPSSPTGTKSRPGADCAPGAPALSQSMSPRAFPSPSLPATGIVLDFAAVPSVR